MHRKELSLNPHRTAGGDRARIDLDLANGCFYPEDWLWSDDENSFTVTMVMSSDS